MTKAEIASRRAVHRQAKVPSLRSFLCIGTDGSQNLDEDGNCVNSGSKTPDFASFRKAGWQRCRRAGAVLAKALARTLTQWDGLANLDRLSPDVIVY